MLDNRSTILDCSLSLFAAKSYDAVGVPQMVEAAGIKKLTLYHYFGSKHGVLEALMQERFTPFLPCPEGSEWGISGTKLPHTDAPDGCALIDLLEPQQQFSVRNGQVHLDQVPAGWAMILQVQ